MEAAEEARLALGEHHVPLRPKADLGDPFQDVEGKAEFLKSDAPLLDGGKRPPAKLPALLKEGDKKAGVKGVPEDLGHLRLGKLRAQGTSKELKVLRRPVKEMNEHLEKLRDNIEGMMAEKSSTNAKEIGKTLEYAESVRTARVMGGGGCDRIRGLSWTRPQRRHGRGRRRREGRPSAHQQKSPPLAARGHSPEQTWGHQWGKPSRC